MGLDVRRRLRRGLCRGQGRLANTLRAPLIRAGVLRCPPPPLPRSETEALYAPLPAAETALQVFHLGHSLVGRDMPAMLQQLAPRGHRYHSQLGWGTPLRAHWEPEEEIGGFERENDHPYYRDAQTALASGEYDAVVLTEMVEIRAAIDYFDSAEYLAKWVAAARAGNPQTRVYLYETWHRLDDPEGWLARLDQDLERYWIDEVLRRALTADPAHQPIYLIPGGQVMAAFARLLAERDGVPGIDSQEDLFRFEDNGMRDLIHLNDLGNYLIALTHFAVLYRHSPLGLPHQLTRADGSKMQTIPAETARLMQETAWSVVRQHKMTGSP